MIRGGFHLPSKSPGDLLRGRRTFASPPRESTCPDWRTIRDKRYSRSRERPLSARRPLVYLEDSEWIRYLIYLLAPRAASTLQTSFNCQGVTCIWGETSARV